MQNKRNTGSVPTFPMPETKVPVKILPSCFSLGYDDTILKAVSDFMDRTIAATPEQMGPEVKVRIAQKLKDGIKIECEQSKNNSFCMFGTLTEKGTQPF